jgi:hypothetical protein
MDVYLGKGRAHAITDVTATRQLEHSTEKAEGHGCKLHMDKLLCRLTNSKPDKKKLNCCRAVRPERKECHRALFAACFLLVSHLTHSSTLMTEAVVPLERQWTSTRLHSVMYEMTVLLTASSILVVSNWLP